MKTMTRTFMFVLIALLLSISIGRSQQLVRFQGWNRADENSSSLLGMQRVGEQVFALIGAEADTPVPGGKYEILDQDTEGKNYFWIIRRPGSGQSGNILTAVNAHVLWRGADRLLVHGSFQLANSFRSRDFLLQRADFNSAPITEAAHTADDLLPKSTLPADLVQAIIDSVNIDKIYQTEEHISGEKAFVLDGQLDTILTRYSYSDGIYKAQDYLTARLEDYGYRVEQQPFGLYGTFYDVQFEQQNQAKGWLIMNDEIYGTSDGGNYWQRQFATPDGRIMWSLFPAGDGRTYAVGEQGLIVRTMDGQNWTALQSGTGNFLFGVYFVDNDHGWVCGDGGLILMTSNGGDSWSLQSTPVGDRLYDIRFTDLLNGWAVGRQGRILHTSDGGKHWNLQASGVTTRLYGIHMLDSMKGFVVGWEGVLLKTANGGASWARVSLSTQNYLYDIDFVSPSTGMIVGWRGTCLVTRDGGASWQSAGNILMKSSYGFDLLSTTTAWTGGGSLLAKTDDFGDDWRSRLETLETRLMNNLIATKTGLRYPDEQYIICAHYDATSNDPFNRAPGADDNGSGTSAVIEAARVLARYDFDYTLKFVLFPGEEQGLWGSKHFAGQAKSAGTNIRGVLNMDMIGYDSNDDGIVEIHSGTTAAAQSFGDQIASNISAWGLDLKAQVKKAGASTASDHSSFWNEGYPAVMVIEDFENFTPWYHTTSDLLSSLNKEYFGEVARLCIGSMAAFAGVRNVDAVSAPAPQMVAAFRLAEPYPNPFNPVVHIPFQLARSGKVQVEIYNMSGQRIFLEPWQQYPAGWSEYVWKATNSGSQSIASGIYLVRLKSGKMASAKKVLHLR